MGWHPWGWGSGVEGLAREGRLRWCHLLQQVGSRTREDNPWVQGVDSVGVGRRAQSRVGWNGGEEMGQPGLL